MGITGYPQRRTIITGGLGATAVLLTGCSSQASTTQATQVGAAGTASAASGARSADSVMARSNARVRRACGGWLTCGQDTPH
jgi:hypothetical protein